MSVSIDELWREDLLSTNRHGHSIGVVGLKPEVTGRGDDRALV
jgi:hypothetical protein